MNGYDCIVVGTGPSVAPSAADLAAAGHSVLLLDCAGRIKPCGSAIAPRLHEQASYLCRSDGVLAHFLPRYAALAANSTVIQP